MIIKQATEATTQTRHANKPNNSNNNNNNGEIFIIHCLFKKQQFGRCGCCYCPVNLFVLIWNCFMQNQTRNMTNDSHNIFHNHYKSNGDCHNLKNELSICTVIGRRQGIE